MMSDPETALKNAVFEYLLATNNVKSAEVFFKESNLESQYDVSVEVMLRNTRLYGSSCLICKLFNNWYSFAQNQRQITPSPSVLLHANQKDEHMQQFLQFYHTHEERENAIDSTAAHNATQNEHATLGFTPPISHTNQPIQYTHTTSTTTTTSTVTLNSPTFPSSPNITHHANTKNNSNNTHTFHTSSKLLLSPSAPAPEAIVLQPEGQVESAIELGNDKSNEAIAEDSDEYLFSVGRKLFAPQASPSASDPFLNLLHNTLASPAALNISASPSTSPSVQSPAAHMSGEEADSMDGGMADIDLANVESKAGRFCCPYPACNKSFSTSAILKRHIKEHSGDRPFKCTFEGCGKGFARNYDLKVHMRSHTGEKPYRCTFMGCERTFTRSSDLRLHERIHKGEKPFVCDCAGCQKRFVRYADLKKHKRTHEVHEGHHPHVHGAGCGHTAIAHEDHIDYLHDAHLHNIHKDHVDDHKIGVTDTNPNTCTHTLATQFACDPTHTHNDKCGHELVPHFDHYDYLVDGHLHYVHDSHCDDHGWIDVVNWNPSDFPLDSGGGSSSPGMLHTHAHAHGHHHHHGPHENARVGERE